MIWPPEVAAGPGGTGVRRVALPTRTGARSCGVYRAAEPPRTSELKRAPMPSGASQEVQNCTVNPAHVQTCIHVYTDRYTCGHACMCVCMYKYTHGHKLVCTQRLASEGGSHATEKRPFPGCCASPRPSCTGETECSSGASVTGAPPRPATSSLGRSSLAAGLRGGCHRQLVLTSPSELSSSQWPGWARPRRGVRGTPPRRPGRVEELRRETWPPTPCTWAGR